MRRVNKPIKYGAAGGFHLGRRARKMNWEARTGDMSDEMSLCKAYELIGRDGDEDRDRHQTE